MNRFKNILCVSEERTDQISAVERAVSLAENNQAKLGIISVIPPVPEDLRAETVKDRMQMIKTLAEPYQKRLDIRFEASGRRHGLS
ncbi:MAG: hypothetical protein R2941_14935 [Desulfobacterales bacterium]